MLSVCTHACSQSLSALVDGHVNNVPLQTVPDFNEALLQLIDTVHSTFIHSLLHNTPDLIIHWIQVLAIWWPEIRSNEVQQFLLWQFNSVLDTERWSVLLLKHKPIACNMLDCWQHLLRE